MIIQIDKKLLTINHLYFHRGNMKILSTEARTLRKYINECVKKQIIGQVIPDGPLKVEIEVYENWLTKKGLIKRKDISNREKFFTDSIFQALGIDDKFIVDLRYIKVQDLKEEKAIIKIEKAIW